uniref:Reverse transcriptase domain-containing protein n=1 Tax=Rhizophagus irregularis (strain DAOM 181602 / DAOM 197198 / MUCL 43194) TaxID=747089 RepID=U9TGX9_RHIID
MAISETNIDYRQEYFINQDIKSKVYSIIFSECDQKTKRSGTALVIHNRWMKHHYSIVWSIYAAPNDQDMRKSLIDELKMAMEGHNRSVHNTIILHIVLGDFNDTINNKIDRSPSTRQPGSQFLIQLSQLGLYDVCRVLYPDAELFTHEKWNKNKNRSAPISKSRIDQIWITYEPDVIPVEFLLHSLQMVTNSHHSIISTTLNISGFIRNNFRHCVPDQLQDPDLHQDKHIVDIRDEKNTDGEKIKRRFNELWDNIISAISITMNIELLMKLIKYPESCNTRHKLIFADKTMRYTTKLESLIRKICKDQDFIAIKDAHWIDYWLNRFNKYNDDYKNKEYDKFIDKPKGKFTECIANLMDEITLEEWQQTLEQKFDYILANMRSIALLNNIRKSVTKLLTNRLSTILIYNKVLRELNFCGLKEKDTAILLRLMNDIIKDARENGKELWMVTQDMMKITGLFKDRQMSVITAFDPSSTFIVGDVIQQACNQQQGYKMVNTWPLDIQDRSIWQQYRLRVPVIAYMDDTSYLDSSGDKIQASINIATQFYHFHDVNINGKKSELMTISGENIPIREIFITHRCFNLLRKIGISNSYPLIYASQLMLPSGHTMSWAYYHFIARLSAKGRIAKWFQLLT